MLVKGAPGLFPSACASGFGASYGDQSSVMEEMLMHSSPINAGFQPLSGMWGAQHGFWWSFVSIVMLDAFGRLVTILNINACDINFVRQTRNSFWLVVLLCSWTIQNKYMYTGLRRFLKIKFIWKLECIFSSVGECPNLYATRLVPGPLSRSNMCVGFNTDLLRQKYLFYENTSYEALLSKRFFS